MSNNNPPMTLSGLLKWSLKYSDGESTIAPMTDERKQEVQELLDYVMENCKDPCEVIKEKISELNEETATNEEIINVIETINDCMIEVGEIARILHKLGGLTFLLKYAEHPDETVSIHSLKVLSYALSNNPILQKEAWKDNALTIFMNPPMNASKFSALANLIRHEKEIEQEFLRVNGLTCVHEAIKSETPKLQMKSASLLCHLCDESLLNFNDILNHNLIPVMIQMINSDEFCSPEGLQFSEICCNTILSMVKIIEVPLLKKNNMSLFDKLKQTIDSKLKYLKSCETNSVIDNEIESLSEAYNLLN